MIRLRSYLMTRVWILHPHMLPSLRMKDWLEMLPRIKLREIQETQCSMLKEWSAESFLINLSRKIWSTGHSKLSRVQVTNLWSLLTSRTKLRSSIQRRSHQWFWLRWRILQRLSSQRSLQMLSLLYQPISMIPRDRLLRMLDSLGVLMFWESLTSPQLQPLPMGLTNKLKERRMFWSSILVVAHSMSLYLPLMKVSSKLRLPMVTPISVVKISTIDLLISAHQSSRNRLGSTLWTIQELSVDSGLNARKQREFFPQLIRHLLSVRLLLRVSISTQTYPEPSLKNCAWTNSGSACLL